MTYFWSNPVASFAANQRGLTGDERRAWEFLRYDAPDRDTAPGAQFARATTLEVAEALGVPLEEARRILNRLVKRGLIERAGRLEPGLGFQARQRTQEGRQVLGYQMWEIHWS